MMMKLASSLLLTLLLACGLLVPQAAIAGDRCATRDEFRAVHTGMRTHRVQYIFDGTGWVSHRDGSDLVKSYVRCGGTRVTGPWAVITYDHRQLAHRGWEVPGAD